jgi:NADH-quinone oxidoreductase subunit M
MHRSPAHDLAVREHIALWPMAVLMVVMGVASPYWIRAIDRGVHALSNAPALTHPTAALSSSPAPDREAQ